MNVKITISFEVNIVKIATIKYKDINNTFWLDLKFLTNKNDKYLKNPTSSKNIDKNVIEKNNNNIFIGFIIELENKPSTTSLIEIQLNNKIKKAPTEQTIQ